MNDHGVDCKQHVLLVVAVLLFALINLLNPLVANWIHSTVDIEYGLPLFLLSVLAFPMLSTVVMYPIVGIPIANSRFRRPLSRRAMKKQALWAVLFLPTLTILAEIGVVLLAQFADPLIAVPLVGEIVRYLQAWLSGYAWIVLLYPTTVAAVLGVWCALLFYWIVSFFDAHLTD